MMTGRPCAITTGLGIGLCLGLMALGSSVAYSPNAPQQVIVTVDLKAILMNSLPGRAAQLKFKEHVTKAKAKIDSKTSELKQLEKEISSPGFMALSQAERRDKQRLFEKEKLDLKFLVDDTNKELQDKQTRMMNSLTKQVRSVIEKIAKQKGYDLVLMNSPPSMVYSSGATDVTAEVLSALESEWVKKVPDSSTAKPAPAGGSPSPSPAGN